MKKSLQGVGLGFFIMLSIILFIGLPGQKVFQTDLAEINGEIDDVPKKWSSPLNNVTLVDNKALYTNQGNTQADKIFVTVLPPQSPQAVTLNELNNYVSADDSELEKAVEIFFAADKPGNIPAGDLKANAIMQLRGDSARRAPQKSYKIKLFDETGEWFGYNIINLNKHYYSSLRVENKLAFDYFSRLPDFVGMRTRFVRLYVKDLSASQPSADYQDYGFFTFIEQPNKKFLMAHNLDKYGHLYKAEFFEFYRYPDVLKAKDDVSYNQQEFEKILGISGNDNHQMLLDMLDAVNDYNQDINTIVDHYFDRNNLLTWVAVNILFDNYDTSSRNFFLYSPLNSDKWFFIPWDYDKLSIEDVYLAKWQKGLTNYWGMVLFNRFFRDSANVEALGEKIEELTELVDTEDIQGLLQSYYNIATENLYKPPDINYVMPRSDYEKYYRSVGTYIETNKKDFFASLESPMPFFLSEPVAQEGSYLFKWGASFDLQGDDLLYELTIGLDPEFHTIAASYSKLQKTSQTVTGLQPGQYFWKVVAYDNKGNWQAPFDYYRDSSNRLFFGVRQVVLK